MLTEQTDALIVSQVACEIDETMICLSPTRSSHLLPCPSSDRRFRLSLGDRMTRIPKHRRFHVAHHHCTGTIIPKRTGTNRARPSW